MTWIHFIDPIFYSNTTYLNDVSMCDTVQYIPNIKKGKVLKILNGNTLLVAASIHGSVQPVYRFVISMKNVYRTDVTANAKDYTSRRLLNKFILDKIVYIKDLASDESGVMNANIYLGGIHVNQIIVDFGLGTSRKVSFAC